MQRLRWASYPINDEDSQHQPTAITPTLCKLLLVAPFEFLTTTLKLHTRRNETWVDLLLTWERDWWLDRRVSEAVIPSKVEPTPGGQHPFGSSVYPSWALLRKRCSVERVFQRRVRVQQSRRILGLNWRYSSTDSPGDSWSHITLALETNPCSAAAWG